MLILTRRKGERVRVRVGSVDVWVVVLGESESNLRIGVDAPAAVTITREELLPPAERWRPREGR